jgi:hypothetical protein
MVKKYLLIFVEEIAGAVYPEAHEYACIEKSGGRQCYGHFIGAIQTIIISEYLLSAQYIIYPYTKSGNGPLLPAAED